MFFDIYLPADVENIKPKIGAAIRASKRSLQTSQAI